MDRYLPSKTEQIYRGDKLLITATANSSAIIIGVYVIIFGLGELRLLSLLCLPQRSLPCT